MALVQGLGQVLARALAPASANELVLAPALALVNLAPIPTQTPRLIPHLQPKSGKKEPSNTETPTELYSNNSTIAKPETKK